MARKNDEVFQVVSGDVDGGQGEEKNALEEIQDLLKSLPSAGDAYLKIYKTKPLPPGSRPQFMGEVNEIGLIEDLEIYLRNLARENKWGTGEYLVSAIPKNRKVKAPPPVRLNINYDEEKTKPDAGEELKHKVGELKELITTIKDLLGPVKDPGLNTAEVSRALSDSFKLGMETLKGIIPSQDENKLISTISQLQTLGLLGPKGEQTNQGELILQMLKVIKETGLLDKKETPPPPDLFSQLGKLKELGLIKIAGEKDAESDPFQMVEKLKSLIDIVRPLISPGGEAEKPTLGIELVRILGPHVPKMVERIATTIDGVTEVSKLRLTRAMGGSPSPLPASPPPIAPPSPSTQRHPTIQQVYDAIEAGDKEFFPKLKEMLDIYVGPHIIPSLLNKSLNVDQFLQSLAQNLNEPFLVGEKAKVYFNNFLASFPPPSSLVATCRGCSAEYEFSDAKEFEASDKKCEDCGGLLVPNSPRGE